MSGSGLYPLPTAWCSRRRANWRAAAAELERSLAAVAGNRELLQLIFERLPPVEQVLTASRLSHDWRSWAAPRAAALRRARAACNEWAGLVRIIESAAPQWAVEEAWPILRRQQRDVAYARAAYWAQLSLLKWLRNNTRAFRSEIRSDVSTAAALGGHIEVLQWLNANSCPCDEDACEAAAGSGHLEVLQCLHANGCRWDRDACAAAAKGGHLEVLQWLHANGCPCDKEASAGAVKSGHLAVLQWLHANGFPWPVDACSEAAEGGHLEVLQWLHANGDPCEADAFAAAASGGQLAVLQWLHANGCPLDYSVAWSSAKRFERFEVMEWLSAISNSE